VVCDGTGPRDSSLGYRCEVSFGSRRHEKYCYYSPVVAKSLVAPERLGPGITDGLLPTEEELGGILVAAWAKSICRLFRPEAALRER